MAYCFVEFESDVDAKNAIEKFVDYPLDKQHKLTAIAFKTFMDAMDTPDELKITEDPFEVKVSLQPGSTFTFLIF